MRSEGVIGLNNASLYLGDRDFFCFKDALQVVEGNGGVFFFGADKEIHCRIAMLWPSMHGQVGFCDNNHCTDSIWFKVMSMAADNSGIDHLSGLDHFSLDQKGIIKTFWITFVELYQEMST